MRPCALNDPIKNKNIVLHSKKWLGLFLYWDGRSSFIERDSSVDSFRELSDQWNYCPLTQSFDRRRNLKVKWRTWKTKRTEMCWQFIFNSTQPTVIILLCGFIVWKTNFVWVSLSCMITLLKLKENWSSHLHQGNTLIFVIGLNEP